MLSRPQVRLPQAGLPTMPLAYARSRLHFQSINYLSFHTPCLCISISHARERHCRRPVLGEATPCGGSDSLDYGNVR